MLVSAVPAASRDQIGNRAVARLFPDRQFKIDLGPVAAAALCYLARVILGIFF